MVQQNGWMMFEYPRVFRLRQTFERPRVEDVPGTVEAQLASLALAQRVRPGQTVAITAGSRGIANLAVILRAIVGHFRRLGAEPFLVPAMGSHGGGTAGGQRELLDGYDVNEMFCGCPVRSSMETVVVCQAAEGFPVHFDRLAFEADHVVVCGRVKPHTNFAGEIESGLLKMLLIGLGKHDGARIYHRAIKDYSFDQIVHSVAREVLARCPVLAGLAVLENGYDETAHLEAVRPEDFEPREKALLQMARRWMPKLPFARADLLLIDRIGKDISGTGMDTNIVGRKFGIHEAGVDEWPKIRYIAVRGLTAATHGNATGLGLAEFCLSRVVQQTNAEITRINSLTGGHGIAAMTPLDYATDRKLLDAALPTIGLTEPAEAKCMWIRDTLHVAELACSAAYWSEAQDRPDLEILGTPCPLPFDGEGNLPDSVADW
jgi:hypothetical protein